MEITKDTKFLIVGLGLIGGSYARALTKQGYQVKAITRSQSSIDYAMAEHLIADGRANPDPELIREADVIVFALYPHVFVQWIEDYQQHFHPGAIITDVTGVKTSIVGKIQGILRPDVEFIAAHPMAGREVYGVENSDEKIFRNANYIVVPTEKNTPEAIALCEELGKLLGFAKVSRLTPEKHDEMIAFLSQLTHCIAVALMTCNENEHLEDYTGDSFRDLTRIANINEKMWSELFLLNKEPLLEQMRLFRRDFDLLMERIAADDVDGIQEMMVKSTARRKLFNKRTEEEK